MSPRWAGCFLLLLGCSSAPRAGSGKARAGLDWTVLSQVDREPDAQPPDQALDATARVHERALVHHVMERGYGGRAFVGGDAWARMMSQVDAATPATVGAWCDALADAFWELPDAHLRAARQSIPERFNVRCGTRAKAAARKSSVGPNRGQAPEGIPWSAGHVVQDGRTVAWLSVTSFPSHGAPEWAGFTGAVAALRQADAVVVDLRRNGGGDDTRGFELAQALKDAPAITGVVRTHLRQTPETLTLLLNTLDRMGRGPDGVLVEHLRGFYGHVEAWRTRVLQTPSAPDHEVRRADAEVPPGPNAYRGKVAVLVDAACASSCESTLDALRRLPTARVFGERTAGFIHFGDVGSFTLPHSGIRLMVPTKFHAYPEGKLYDKVGFEPDEPVNAGTDAWDAAVKWIAVTPR
jgi:hypothetical protein